MFDCDGVTHEFEGLEAARAWLLEDEFVSVGLLEAEDLAEHGWASADLSPPTSRRTRESLAGMLERRTPRGAEADASFARLLLVVEDRFAIRGHDLIVVPGPELAAVSGPFVTAVELHRPDGTRAKAQASIQLEFSSPARAAPRRWACILSNSDPIDVAAGTEVWLHPRYSV